MKSKSEGGRVKEPTRSTWETWKLGHLAKVGNGSTPNRDNHGYWHEGSIPWLNSSVVNEHQVTSADQFVTEQALRECHLPMVPAGSVLVGITGQGKTRGSCTVLSFDATVNQHVAFIVPDKQRTDVWFLHWAIGGLYNYLRAISDDNGGTKGALTCEALSNLRISLPDFAQQQAIAAYLDRETARMDGLIAAKERLLELLAEKRRSLVTRLVTRGLNPAAPQRDSGIPWLESIPKNWEMKRCKWLFRERDERSVTGEEELLSLRKERGLVPHNEVSVKLTNESELVGYKKCSPGELVINRMRASIGLIALSPSHGLVSPDYAVFQQTADFNIGYFTALFKTDLVGEVFRSISSGLGTGSQGFLRLYSQDFLSLWFPFPPLAEQHAIVARIATETAKLDRLRAVAERSMALLKERRAALISAAVTGKIDVSTATATD